MLFLPSMQERDRIRQDDFRIVYKIQDQILIVIVVRIGHHRDGYGRR